MSSSERPAVESTSFWQILALQTSRNCPAIIERLPDSKSELPREPAHLGGLLKACVQFGGRLPAALMLTSALLLTSEWHQVACHSASNALVQATANSEPKPTPPTRNSSSSLSAARSRNEPETMLANAAQTNAMLLAQPNGVTPNARNINELDPTHVPSADFHAPNHTNPTQNQPNKPAGPEPGDPNEFYQFAVNNENNASAGDRELQNATDTDAQLDTEFDFDENSPSRDILTQYLFILFRHRNMFNADTSNEQPTGNGSAPLGDLSAANGDLVGLGAETPQLMGVPASVGPGRAATSGPPGGATIPHSSHPTLAGAGDELNPNALWVSTTNRPYLGEFFSALNSAYLPYHSVICLVICVIGIFSNVTNIIVLTRPNMITAVNTILCAIACSDLIVNLSNIPYLSHLLSDTSDPTNFFTYGWALYTLMHAHVSVTAHTISIWLTCVLATWRYFVIRSQSISQRNWSVQLVLRVILGVIICVPILCTPSYLSFAILIDPPSANLGIGTTYRVGFSRLAEQSQVIRTFHFWMFSALTKLLPCVMLAFFTIVLVKKLLQARDRRLRLAQSNASATNNSNIGGQAAPNSQGGTNLTSFDSQHGRLSIPNGRPPGSPVLERQHSAKGTRSHVHVIDQLTGSNEPILANDIANGADEPSDDASRRRRKMSQASDNLQQLARRESLRNVLVGNRKQGSHDSNGQANGSLDHEQHSRRPQRGACSVAPHSGSSCATDAECLQASSCNASSNGSINISLERFHLDSINAPDARTTQVFGHLLVESALSPASYASGATAQHRTTLISPLPPSSGASSPRREVELDRANKSDRYLANSLVPEEAPRSSSTCGALELYAQLDAHDGNETSLRLGALTPAQPAARSQRHLSQPPTRPSLAVSAQDFKMHENDANLLARGSMSHSNLRTADQRLAGAAEGRGRSMGSATFTPFQIVKLQATQRQLSQNETTTRLLIGVMIIFLICEFPAGILSALCAIFGQGFFDNVYQPMGPFTDLFALVNSSVNFILYCFMSTQFRVTFYRVVLRCPAPSAPKSNK